MISYNVYKLLHLMGIFALFLSLGVASVTQKSQTRWASAVHGTALLVILVGGFGLLARLGMTSGLPGWALGKVAIWLLMGGAIVLARRKVLPAPALISLLIALGGVAAYLALWKP